MYRRKPKTIHTKPRAGTWQFQTAKTFFSEVCRRARSEGPQFVIRHGKDAVVVLADEDFEKLSAHKRHPQSLVQFFAQSPLAKAKINLDRLKD